MTANQVLSLRRLPLAVYLASAFAAVACAGNESRKDAAAAPREISTPSVYPKETLTFSASPATVLRPFTERLLPNGLRLLFVEDQALPYVSLSLLVRAGSAQDPKGLSGLSMMTAELLDQGTAHRTATQLADQLALLGADFNASVTEDYATASASSLSPKAGELLDIFSEIVLQPAFADAEIARIHKQTLSKIERRVDEPGAFTSAAWHRFLYGDHPYGQGALGTAAGVNEIKKKNIILHYKHFYRPNNSVLTVVGKITPELKEQVEKTFGAWAPQEVAPATFPELAKLEGLKVRLVEKTGLQQAQIRIGEYGVRRRDDDYLPLRAANVVLGGAFGSRLMQQVRTKLGLTYSINSYFDALLAPGPFTISTFTKPQTVGKTIEETMKVLNEFCAKGVTSIEVDRAKALLKGMFPVAIETAEKFAFNLMLLRLYGVSDLYLSEYVKSVDAITVSDVNRVIAKHLDPKNLKVLVYASSDAAEQLKPFGPVEEINATEALQ